MLLTRHPPSAGAAASPFRWPIAGAVGLLLMASACQEAPVEPAPPAPVSESPPSTLPPPPPDAASVAPSAALAPDLGFTIVAGTPTIVAEAPIVTPEARSRVPRAPGPGNVSSSAPPPAQSPARPAEVSAQNVIRSHFSDIEACYGAVALKDPSVAGRIMVQWTLGADGTPTGVAITQDTVRSAAVTDCIKTRARAWKFPPPAGGFGVVRFPYDLKVQ